MKGDSKVIEYLQGALKKELTAINQYFLHSRMAYDWGLDKLGEVQHREAIDEMHHADKLIQRILFLEALPNLQDLEKLRIGENVKEMHECDMAAELDSLKYYREAAAHCDSVKDFVSRDLFKELISDEEGHLDFLETELALIERVGLQNYQQQLMPDKPGGEGPPS